MKEKVEECKKELEDIKNKFIRISADFENYKRRIEKEKNDWILIAQSEIFLDLLDIIDNFERALKNPQKKVSQECQVFLSGFELIYKSIIKLIHKYGIKEITNFEKFDPKIHEAVLQLESKKHKTGQIVEIIQKGYLLPNNNVLRPAKVSVSK